VLVGELERELGDQLEIVGDEAGMHLATFLTSNCNDRAIAANAAQQSLSLSSLSSLYLGSVSRRGFVLGFGNTKAKDISQAVRHLRSLIAGTE
jgi:DNA-binding transcriptional MocR family regulator